ncbi:MAG: hypothetical protein ACQET3_09110, partial [Promethearchaeati archaeon]
LYLKNSLGRSHLIRADRRNEILTLVSRSLGPIFYVGHGSAKGMKIGEGVMDWSRLANAIEGSPSREHMVVACNSANMEVKDNSKSWIVFRGNIDARISADVVLALHFLRQDDTDKVRKHSNLAMSGYFRKFVLGSEEPAYLYIPGPGGGGGGSTSYDFVYEGIYWDAYSTDPDDEIYYDHPDYTHYYSSMGVGPADAFSLHPDDVRADHIDRATVDFWKLGGLATIAEFLFGLGVAIAMTVYGLAPGATIAVIAAVLAAAAFSAAYIAETFLEDETDSGWVFYKEIVDGVKMKIGSLWWILVSTGAVVPLIWTDGRYIR